MTFTIADVNEEIRFLLGDLPVSVISDENLNKIIQRSVDNYSLEDEDFCIVTYESLLSTLQWLINKEQASSTTEITRRREKVGDVEIQLEYSESAPNESTGWENLLDKFKNDPAIVCESLAYLAKSDLGYALFGGVSQKEYQRVKDNPDSRNGYDVETEYRKSPYSCFSNRRKNKRYYDI
jgi:hypothetical protein